MKRAPAPGKSNLTAKILAVLLITKPGDHLLQESLSWHDRYVRTGRMRSREERN
jgi:hypothetical protein